MIWLRMISWGIGRGLISGAVAGAILGTLLYPIWGTLYGLFLGGMIGAILGLIDGVSLAFITRFAYEPPDHSSRYSKLVYTAPILINTAPILFISVTEVANHFSVPNVLIAISIGGLIASAMGYLTAYFVGLFLEFVDSLMMQKASRNPPANVLS